MIEVGIIGYGALASDVVERLTDLQPRIALTAVALREGSASSGMVPPGVARITRPEDWAAAAPDLVLECAGASALADWGAASLSRPRRLLVSSVGALMEDDLRLTLDAAARRSGARLIPTDGAVPGIGAAVAAAAGPGGRVRHLMVKPPAAWAGSPAAALLDLGSVAERTVFFRGTAREAALKFPRNANVTAALALKGLGPDQTEVALAADPSAIVNGHSIEISGAFGHIALDYRSRALAANPRTSELTAITLVRELKELAAMY